MAGSNQAVNLTGMLNQLSQDIGGFADVQANYGNAIRNLARPDLDMDNPETMGAYAQWLINNGKPAEGQAMMAQAANLKRKNRALQGEVAISKLASRWHRETDPDQKQKISDKISSIAGESGVSPESIRQIMLRESLEVREQGRKEDDTDSNIQYRSDSTALTRKQIDNNYEIANKEAELNNRRLAEQIRASLEREQLGRRAQTEIERSAVSREGLTRLGLENEDDRYYSGLDQRKYEFGQTMDLEERKFDDSVRMNDFLVAKGWAEVGQGDRRLDNDEARIAISQLLADEQITMGDFRRVIMGNEDARAAEMQPYQIQLLESQVAVALSNVDLTQARRDEIMYDLFEKKDTASIRKRGLALANDMAKANIGLTEAQESNLIARTKYTKQQTKSEIERTRNEELNGDLIERQIEALALKIKLEPERWQHEQMIAGWEMGMDELRVQLQEKQISSGISLNEANIANLNSLSSSRTFQDQMHAAKILGDAESEVYNLAYSLKIDPLNAEIVGNRRQMFINEYGVGAAVDFDNAMTERAERKRIELEVLGLRKSLETAKMPTRASLEKAGYPNAFIDLWEPVTDRATKISMLEGEANRLLTPTRTGEITESGIKTWEGIADTMIDEVFGYEWFLTLGGDGVYTDELKSKIALAMAGANARGADVWEIYSEGVNAMMPTMMEQGGSSVQNFQNLKRSLNIN